MIHDTITMIDAEDVNVVAARALIPALSEASGRIEKAGALTPDVLDLLYAADMFRLLVPKSCGGAEVRPDVFYKVVEALAQGDASVAWCVSQGGGCATSAAYLPPDTAKEIFGTPKGVIAWGPGNAGQAVVVEGGYRVTGSWSFASGIGHSTFVGGYCQVKDESGEVRLNAAGQPLVLTMLFPKTSTEISNVWHVLGLRGTGSNSYTVKDLFVPTAFAFARDSDESRKESGPLYQFQSINMYAIGSAAISLGLARGALDQFMLTSKGKVPFGHTQTLRENAVIQAEVAIADARIKACRAYLLDTVRSMWDSAALGVAFTADQRMDWRLSTTFAMQTAREIVEFFYNAAGATAIFESQPFERRFRDMHAVSQQGHGSMHNYEIVGQMQLGRTEADNAKYRRIIETFGLQVK